MVPISSYRPKRTNGSFTSTNSNIYNETGLGQRVIIPKDVFTSGETIVLDIPPHLRYVPVLLAKEQKAVEFVGINGDLDELASAKNLRVERVDQYNQFHLNNNKDQKLHHVRGNQPLKSSFSRDLNIKGTSSSRENNLQAITSKDQQTTTQLKQKHSNSDALMEHICCIEEELGKLLEDTEWLFGKERGVQTQCAECRKKEENQLQDLNEDASLHSVNSLIHYDIY